MAHRHPAILWLAALRDVDIGHDLQARDHAVLDVLGRTLHLVHHPVDAIPHAHVVLARFDVDVGGKILDALADQEVNKTHDGRVIFLGLVGLLAHELGRPRLLLQLRAQAGEFAIRAVEAVDGGKQVTLLRHHTLDLLSGDGAHVVNGKHVARIDHGEDEVVAREADRQHTVAAAHRGGHKRDGASVDGEVQKLNKREPHEGGAGGRELNLGQHPTLEKVTHGGLFVGRTGHAVETLDRHHATENQNFSQRRHSFTPQ